jgi:hypothetical protein
VNNNDKTRPNYLSTLLFTGGGGGGSGTITVQDEGTEISGSVQTLNFVGADVQVLGSGSLVSIYIPPPTFASHFNTSDGTTDGTVSENIARSTTRISTPTSEGTPFATGGWEGTNQSTTLSHSVTFVTAGEITGLGGDSYFVITMYDADGTTVLRTLTTSAITGDGTYGDAYLNVVISNYATDTTRYKGDVTVNVEAQDILQDFYSRSGGRYNVVISMTTDTTTDDGSTYTYTQSDVFIDLNPSTPSISGTTTIAETSGSVSTKHLSGVEYYIAGSQFSVDVTGIDDLNENTARTSNNLFIDFTNYNISDVNQSPFGTGSSFFSNWTNAFDNTGTDYSRTNFSINSGNFRYRGTGANVRSRPTDTWGNGSYVSSSNASILIDTYGTTSTNLVENFTDENRRQDSGFNSGATGGNWTSTDSLTSGEAMVIGGQLIVPSAATLTSGSANADWSSYSPTAGGSNPNYSSLTAPVNYYRTIVDSVGSSRAGFTIVFSGSFVSNATTDLANEDLQIFISRIASTTGGKTGPTNADFLEIHGSVYNFSTFDDGTTDGHIRESSSSGNTVNCTFGGFDCQDGFYMHIRINDDAIKISSLTVSFS